MSSMEGFEPLAEGELPTADELMDKNTVDADTVDEAATEWKKEPPSDEFKNLLAAKPVD